MTIEGICAASNETVGAVVAAAAVPPTAGWPGITDSPWGAMTTPGGGNGTLCAQKELPKRDQPNTALLSCILMFGTYLLANQLKVFKNSHYLGKSVS